jgi:hypothetical protein
MFNRVKLAENMTVPPWRLWLIINQMPKGFQQIFLIFSSGYILHNMYMYIAGHSVQYPWRILDWTWCRSLCYRSEEEESDIMSDNIFYMITFFLPISDITHLNLWTSMSISTSVSVSASVSIFNFYAYVHICVCAMSMISFMSLSFSIFMTHEHEHECEPEH